LQLTIEKLVYGGDGIARLPADEHGRGKAVFVPFVLDGETVDVSISEEKRGFARGWPEEILQPSSQRIEPDCPYFRHCGGCHYQHSSYHHQLETKAAILKENLRRIAKLELESAVIVHASPPWNYRNRARLKLRLIPDFALGFYRLNSHLLLPVEQCPICSPLITRAITAAWEMGRAGSVPPGTEEIEFQANADDSQLLVSIFRPGTDHHAFEDWAKSLNQALPGVIGVVQFATERSHVPSGIAEPRRTAKWGTTELAYQTRSAAYRVTAGAFFQINRFLVDELTSAVLPDSSGKTALDLYAGVGLFSKLLARSFAQVVAVESSPTAYSDLLYNSPTNVTAVRQTAEEFLKSASGKLKADFVVMDPPRSGLGERVVGSLLAMGAPRLTYVSCDPATLARDLAGLLAGGYRLDTVHLLDLFPQTYHLESVIHLVR